jgi:hypothetical protein
MVFLCLVFDIGSQPRLYQPRLKRTSLITNLRRRSLRIRYDRSLLYYVGGMTDTRVRRKVTNIEKCPRSPDIYICRTGQSVIDIVQILTHLFTPWSRVLLEKLTVNFAASQEIPRIYGTRNFLIVPTSVRHLSLS